MILPAKDGTCILLILNFASCVIRLAYIPFFTEFPSFMISRSRVFYTRYVCLCTSYVRTVCTFSNTVALEAGAITPATPVRPPRRGGLLHFPIGQDNLRNPTTEIPPLHDDDRDANLSSPARGKVRGLMNVDSNSYYRR